MFKKNGQQNYHNALANSFNRKKTIENETKRFKNIQPIIKREVDLNIISKKKNLDSSLVSENTTNRDIYKMNNILTSSNIHLNNLHMKNNDDNIIVPKIECKEIIIPNYSYTDNYDVNSINQNINKYKYITLFLVSTLIIIPIYKYILYI